MSVFNNPFRDLTNPVESFGGLPTLPPQVTEDLLDRIGDGLAGGLSTIGGILDKPGRAVRGLVNTVTGGGPQSLREILAILPFSDALGVTRESDRVSGEQILRNVGAISDGPSEGFDENDAAGIAAEILFDPLSYLGVGTLTRGGKAFAKAGGKTKIGFRGRAAGADFLADDVARIASGTGDVRARDLVRQSEVAVPSGVTGVTPKFNLLEEPLLPDLQFNYFGTTPKTAENAVEALDVIQKGGQVPFGRYNSFGGFTPAGEPILMTLDATPAGATVRNVKVTREATNDATRLGNTLTFGKLPLGIDRALGIDPFVINSGTLDAGLDSVLGAIQGGLVGRQFTRAFDSRVGNAATKEVQEVQRDIGAPAREAYSREALDGSLRLKQQALDGFAPLIEKGMEGEAMRFLRQAVELRDPFDAAGSGVRYAAPRAFADYEAQLATRQANNPAAFANRLDEMRASGELAAMQGSWQGMRQLADDMSSFMETVRKSEEALGVKASELFDEFINYLPRQKNPLQRRPDETAFAFADRSLRNAIKVTNESQIGRKEMLKNVPGGTTQIEDWVANVSLRAMPKQDQVKYFVEELTGVPMTTATSQKVLDQARQLASWVDGLGDYGRNGLSLFDGDLLASIERRALVGAKAKGGADATLEGLARFSMPRAVAAIQNRDYVSVREFLGEANMGRNARELLARDMKVPVAALDDLVVPADIAADLGKVQKAWTQPEEMKPVLELWDKGLQMFKGAVTYPFPAFHVRNLGSGMYNMWRDGALSKSAMDDSWQVLTRSDDLPYMTREQLVREAVSGRVAFTKAGRQVDSLGNQELIEGLPGKLAGEGFAENLAAGARANAPTSWKDVGFIVREGKAAGSFVEDFIRLSHYLAKRKQGFAPEVAADSVRKYQYDYTRFTQAERNLFKRVIPWWSFSRNNLPPVMEELATNPARLAATIRGATAKPDGKFVPAYLAENIAIPIPGAEPGSERYIASLGLPVEDELIRALGNVLGGNLGRATQQAVGMTAPAIKFPLEQAFGIQAHSGRKLDDLRPTPAAQALGAIPEGLGLGQVEPSLVNQLIGLTPLTRFGTVAGQLVDDRKDPLAKAANLLSGTWVTDVDGTKMRNIAVRDVLQEMLRGDDAVTNWQKFYVKPENFGQLDPQQQMVYLLYRSLEEKAKAEAAARAQKQAGLAGVR